MDAAVSQSPSVGVTKTFVYTPAGEGGEASVDETIAYTIIASNDGNVDLSRLTITDERFLNSEGWSRKGLSFLDLGCLLYRAALKSLCRHQQEVGCKPR